MVALLHTNRARSNRHILVALASIAVVLRIASALYQGNSVEALPGIYDQLSYHPLAIRLLNGYGFSFETHAWPATRANEPTAHWSFLYTLYLSGVYLILGVHPLAARLIQAVLAGILHVILAVRIGQRVGGVWVGAMSGFLTATYLYFVYYGGSLMTESWYIVGVLWTLDTALRLRSVEPGVRSWRNWGELGLAIGITTLLRQSFLLFVPVLALWLLWIGARDAKGVRRFSQPLIGLAGAALVTLALILPWTIRNYLVFDTYVPLNTNAGYAFFWGNHPIYGTHFVAILPPSGPSYQDLIPAEYLQLNEAELDRALLKQGVGFVRSDPVRYLLLSMSRTREYFKFWPSPQSSMISNIARTASFGILLPFMLLGLWLGLSRIRNNDNGSGPDILLLLLFVVVYSGIHLLSWALIRYRLPVDAVTIVFAAVGLERIVQRFGPDRWRTSMTLAGTDAKESLAKQR